MKKIKFIFTVLTSIICMSGCSNSSNIDSIIQNNQSSDTSITENTSIVMATSPLYSQLGIPDSSNGEFDVDLTKLNSSMVYAQVYDMIYNGDNYLGKKVKVKGPFAHYKDINGQEYFAVIVSDATACCSQGIEFVLDGDYTYPNDYPPLSTEIIVTGEFNYYKEGYMTYCQLLNATMEIV